MSKESTENQVKVCRNCHFIYKNFSQKFCGNNCERNPPYLVDGKPNIDIEPHEIILQQNPEKKIRWICISCQNEYTQEEVKVKNFVCKSCNAENNVYPFTEKACALCKDGESKLHDLKLEAKVCDLCIKKEFLLNNNKKSTELKGFKKKKEDSKWDGPETIEFKPPVIEKPKDTNIISLTLTILNNNMEIQLFGNSKTITLKDMIRNANGFIPDSIYERLLQKYPDELFQIKFNENQFSFESKMDLMFTELDLKFHAKSPPEKWDPKKSNPLPESKLLGFKGDFFKFLIWVY